MSQALTQQAQQGANPADTVAIRESIDKPQIQPLVKYHVPTFDGDSAMYQARACGFHHESTTAQGEGLCVGAKVFDDRGLHPVIFRNAHAAWITLVNSYKGMVLDIIKKTKAPNDAWQNLQEHYRTRGTREVHRLSHKLTGKTMEPGKGPFNS